MPFTPEQIKALYAPFPLAAHKNREGSRSKTGKIQWFTYVDKPAVQRRLEELFPGDWEFRVVETHRGADYVTVTAAMTIGGVTRMSNGGQSSKYDGDTMDEDMEKGALTEAFRRCASMFGVGLYLYEMDFAIWTEGYEKGQWDDQKKRQQDATSKFEQWYNREFNRAPKSSGGNPQSNGNQPPVLPQSSEPESNGDSSKSSGANANIDWGRIYRSADDLYGQHNHAVNAIKKLSKEGKINGNMATEEIIIAVQAYHASRQSQPAEPERVSDVPF